MRRVDAQEESRREAELGRFKREIDLVRFIEAQSDYHVRQNSGLYARLWRADKDEVVVTRKSDGVWVWCDPRNVVPRSSTGSRGGFPAGDQGTIIDFVQRKLPGPHNLGELRKELRRWTSSYEPRPSSEGRSAPSLQPTKEPDRELVARQLAESPATPTSSYLNARGLRPETLGAARFAGKIHVCPRGEVRFPHRDRIGITGFERKSPAFSGFAPGGTRGLWCSKALPSDTRLVVSEASIECLSFHQLHPHPGTRYVSTGGTISFSQAELLRTACAKMPPGSTLVIATNNDPPLPTGKVPPGARMAALIQELAREANPKLLIERPLPPIGKDWNDTLKEVEKLYIQSVARQPARARR